MPIDRRYPNLLSGLAVAVAALLSGTAAIAQTATLVGSATNYSPAGGQFTLTATINYGTVAPPTALGFEIALPERWSLVSTGGANPPGVQSPPGSTGTLEYAYTTSFPTGSASFTAIVAYPAGLSGTQSISSSAIYRTPFARISIPNLSLSASSGLPVIVTQPVALSVATGQRASFGVVAGGSPGLTYQWRRTGIAIPGATAATFTLDSAQLSDAASYDVVVSNSVGSVISNAALLTVVSAAGPPVIATGPVGQSVVTGASVEFSVVATGQSPLVYQWRKNGAAIPGATASTFRIASAQAGDAGAYDVVVTAGSSSVTSGSAALVVTAAAVPPTISAGPVGQTVSAGTSATLSVTATGSAPLTYQWRKDGTIIPQATGPTLILVGAALTDSGSYTVSVTNNAGSVASAPAIVTVARRDIAGAYIGNLGGGAGTFALWIRGDRTGVFLAYARNAGLLFIGQDIRVDASGRFEISVPPQSSSGFQPPFPGTAAAEPNTTVTGTVSSTGSVEGVLGNLNLSFTAQKSAATGQAYQFAGLFQAGVAGSSAISLLIVDDSGEAFLATSSGPGVDAGRGSLDAKGQFTLGMESRATAAGSVSSGPSTVSFAVTTPSGVVRIYRGGNRDNPVVTDRLLNIATRSPTGTNGTVLIAGFSVNGTEPKPVLVRAVGPTLAEFGVGNSLPAARLELFRNSVSLAVGNDWSAAPDRALIATTASRVGAFALPAASRDAALLTTLDPGGYTVVVTGQDNRSGVALVEVYDASTSPSAPARIVNIASRGFAGVGDDTLTAGIVVSGESPKRLLIRGIGPTLRNFGVPDAVSDPRLRVMQGSTQIAENDNWGAGPDFAVVASAAASAGSFPLDSGSKDAALIINLLPGGYTVQVTPATGSGGAALIEVYEIP